MVFLRKDIKDIDKWDLSEGNKFTSDINIKELTKKIVSYKGKLVKLVKLDNYNFRKFLDEFFSIYLIMQKIYLYHHLRNDQDTTHGENKQKFKKVDKLWKNFCTLTSFINSEILSFPEKK